jgi:hypothetical protein
MEVLEFFASRPDKKRLPIHARRRLATIFEGLLETSLHAMDSGCGPALRCGNLV